jgi:N-acetylmuramic acid 6-phosphate (MurNAc-6-P) etherase
MCIDICVYVCVYKLLDVSIYFNNYDILVAYSVKKLCTIIVIIINTSYNYFQKGARIING